MSYHHHHPHTHKKKYGLLHFFSDAILTCATGGLWLIRIYVREKRN